MTANFDALNQLADYVRDKQKAKVAELNKAGTKAAFADPIPAFRGHGICDGDEWINRVVAGPNGDGDFHDGDPANQAPCLPWPGERIVRRVKPSRRDAKKLTAFEKRTGWRYQIVATNIPAHQGLSGVAGSGQVWFVDALYRDHAEVEDRVKAIKRVGLGLLPSKSWQLNAAWTLAAALDAWTRLLLLHDEPALAAAEPETIRRKLYHLPARLTTHARTRTLHLDRTWPWAGAFTTAWRRATPARQGT